MHAELIKIKKRWSERIKIRLPSVESTWTPATANNRVWLSVLERADLNGKYLHSLDAGLRAFRGSCEQTEQFPRCTVSMGKQLTHLCRPLLVEILSISTQTINLCDLSTGGAGEHATVYIRKVERKMLSDNTLQVSLPIKSETFYGKIIVRDRDRVDTVDVEAVVRCKVLAT